MNDQTDTRPTFETIVEQAITIIRYSETGDERRIEAFRQITKIARIADRLSRDELRLPALPVESGGSGELQSSKAMIAAMANRA